MGILAFSGKTGANTEWLELDWSGNVLERSRTDNLHLAGSWGAFTADDYLYLQGPKWGQVYTLDRASHIWKLLQQQGVGRLIRCYNLVYSGENNTGAILFQWFNQPAAPTQ